jgi:hypothetical protein
VSFGVLGEEAADKEQEMAFSIPSAAVARRAGGVQSAERIASVGSAADVPTEAGGR